VAAGEVLEPTTMAPQAIYLRLNGIPAATANNRRSKESHYSHIVLSYPRGLCGRRRTLPRDLME